MKIYLACPFSHPDAFIRNERFKMVNRKAAEIMQQGYVVFSPISHSFPVAECMGREFMCDSEFWLRQDLPFVEWCDELWIYCLIGWERSKGVRKEIKYAKKLNKPIKYVR